jgi:hypothetical protein
MEQQTENNVEIKVNGQVVHSTNPRQRLRRQEGCYDLRLIIKDCGIKINITADNETKGGEDNK